MNPPLARTLAPKPAPPKRAQKPTSAAPRSPRPPEPRIIIALAHSWEEIDDLRDRCDLARTAGDTALVSALQRAILDSEIVLMRQASE